MNWKCLVDEIILQIRIRLYTAIVKTSESEITQQFVFVS